MLMKNKIVALLLHIIFTNRGYIAHEIQSNHTKYRTISLNIALNSLKSLALLA